MMGLHTVMYYKAAAGAGVNLPVAAAADGTVRVAGFDVFIPKGMNNLAAAAYLGAVSAVVAAQVQAPSLRAMLNYDIAPLNDATAFPGQPPMDVKFDGPLPLAENEPMEYWETSTNAVAQYGLVWLCDGKIAPVSGKIFTVVADSVVVGVAGTWVNAALAFRQALPAGRYQVVGFRCVVATGIAARLFFVGSGWRPGAPALVTLLLDDNYYFRNGRCGVLGEFDNTVPPTVDFVCVGAQNPVVYLDLIKVA